MKRESEKGGLWPKKERFLWMMSWRWTIAPYRRAGGLLDLNLRALPSPSSFSSFSRDFSGPWASQPVDLVATGCCRCFHQWLLSDKPTEDAVLKVTLDRPCFSALAQSAWPTIVTTMIGMKWTIFIDHFFTTNSTPSMELKWTERCPSSDPSCLW